MKKQKREHHGLVETSEYNSWRAMKMRCLNKKYHSYHLWGARGISICDEWLKFSNFLNDIGLKPSRKHTLDRVDNDKGYFKGNCRWALPREQNRNQRKNVRLSYNGKKLTISEIAEITGARPGTLYSWVDRHGIKYAEKQLPLYLSGVRQSPGRPPCH